MPPKPTHPSVTYWAKVIVKDGCWGWSGLKSSGYGTIQRSGGVAGKSKRHYAHRVSYEIHHGPIPTGLDVMHLCHNPECSNPAHLAVGTRKENHATSKAAGRLQRKIPLGDIKTIIMRVANGECKKVIAAEYGCTPQNIAYTVRTQNHG